MLFFGHLLNFLDNKYCNTAPRSPGSEIRIWKWVEYWTLRVIAGKINIDPINLYITVTLSPDRPKILPADVDFTQNPLAVKPVLQCVLLRFHI